MPKKYILTFIGAIFIITFFISCTNRNKKYKETYFPSGKLQSSGWYIKDTIPVDSISYFFENGNLSSTEIRDDSGHLNGLAKSYYESGELYQTTSYVNDLLQGFVYKYFKEGKIQTKAFFLNGRQIGDCYFYNDNGSIGKYDFYDFNGVNYGLIKWDSLGNIVKDFHPVIFIDSVRSYNESVDKKNESSFDVMLIISNPPKCSTKVKIQYISRNGIVMKSDTLMGQPYYFSKERFPDSLSVVKTLGWEYDSINKKTNYQESNGKVNY